MPSITSAFEKQIQKICDLFEARPLLSKALTIVMLILAIGIAIYIRIIPVLKWGFEFHGNDPWIAYWETRYVYEHGLLSWWTLTRDNPATKIFWYPWGRDFVSSDYPGVALWTTLTYHIVKPFGVSLKTWLILQPIVFAAFSIIAIYLAVKELLDGSRLAGVLGALLYALIPATSDRTVAGFVEKEGIALTFIFLFIYLYAKMSRASEKKLKTIYALLAGISAALVGWFWGGFAFVFASIPLVLLVYPIVVRREISLEIIKYSLIVTLTSLVFVSPSLATLKALGFYPSPKIGVGAIALALYIFPVMYYYLGVRRRILTPFRYFLMLLALGIVSIVLISQGIIAIGGRYAYALGLRSIVRTGPLVESIEEHQPALVAHGLSGLLFNWGWTGLFIAVLGAFYLLYKSREDCIYTSIAFLIAFYAYMNATYFESLASAYGVITASAFLGYLLLKALPQKVVVKKKRHKVITYTKKGSILALILAILLLVPVAVGATDVVEIHENLVPSIKAGGAPVSDENPAWYKALDFIKENTSKDAVIVAWWDYGYWISVITGRRTLADGSTLNGTQIQLLAKVLTASNETEALNILRQLKVPVNDTYILTFEVFRFIKQGNKTIVMPAYHKSVGLVDIPKSIWMIRIGGRDKDPGTGKYFYLYVHEASNTMILSPRFDDPSKLPIIYKMMVNGIVYLNIQEKNGTYVFRWFTGTEAPIDPNLREQIKTTTGLDVEYEIVLPNVPTLLYKDYELKDYNQTAMKHIKPYKIIYAPFKEYRDFYVVIFIFKVYFS